MMRLAMPQNIWGLSQGLLGRARTLMPSLRAVGPNTYLTQMDFLKMMGVAVIVHALIFGIAALMPHEKVTNIPVRALSFKLGDDDRVAAYAPSAAPAPAPTAAPVMTASSRDSWRAMPNTPSPVTPEPLKPVEKVEAAPQPKPKPVPKPIAQRQTPVEQPVSQPQPVTSPQQYVREVGAPLPQAVAAALQSGLPSGAVGGSGYETTMTQQTAQAARARYTQEISAWIERHKLYPAEASGREGRAVLRVRIDRAGNVRYYAIEQSSGLQALDSAALDMIRRANPMPAAPQNYPEGNLIEFLIPISFKAPL